ncbi:Hypp551 [Branchiostoma lanceolatum]|uniref:Hypp551 protein n=1 Tax=Branchiostoma lanceolatum TaxID=7740 RepID=A0A8J9VMZ7_BRALA|nr:Hypp551 [Branchiostoma lanceolatum]
MCVWSHFTALPPTIGFRLADGYGLAAKDTDDMEEKLPPNPTLFRCTCTAVIMTLMSANLAPVLTLLITFLTFFPAATQDDIWFDSAEEWESHRRVIRPPPLTVHLTLIVMGILIIMGILTVCIILACACFGVFYRRIRESDEGTFEKTTNIRSPQPPCVTWGKFVDFFTNFRSKEDTKWITFDGKPWPEPVPTTPIPAEEAVSSAFVDPTSLPFRDPQQFVAGSLHNNTRMWSQLAPFSDKGSEVLNWITNRVDIRDFLTPFVGSFKGQPYMSATPPSITLPNARNCAEHSEFIEAEIKGRLEDGSIKVWGKVGHCDPPHLVLPLTVEPSKPRMCWDGRYLNNWTKDCPFKLDSVSEAPRMLRKGGYMTHTVEKSGYSHIYLTEDSRTFFGFKFKDLFFVHCSLPFGWSASAYIFNTTGSVISSYARHLGVPTMLYIDDRLNGEATITWQRPEVNPDPYTQAQIASYVMCELLTRAGYFLSLNKCIIVPTQILVHLGAGLNSREGVFFFPEDKRRKFSTLREAILNAPMITLNALQKFVGKCVSMTLMVPGARIYTRRCNKLMGEMTQKGQLRVKLPENVRAEMEHWRFVDAEMKPVPWRDERHTSITIASDSSGYRWGAVLHDVDHKGSEVELGDYWPEQDRPLPRIPRQWTPSVACPDCHRPNDHNFRRCQMCGYVRQPFPPPRKRLDVDEEKIQKRLEDIHQLSTSIKYGKKKAALENELKNFLGNRKHPKDLATASPKDVCAFLVWKDEGGKTVVHKNGCKNFGKKWKSECGCPQRLAAGTVDSVIGQLRSIFAKSGRGGDWNDAICTGNPAAAPMVQQYLRVTKAEQANALIQPTQAQPVFHHKLASAITMAMGGASQSALMEHVGWRSKATAQRYLQLRKVFHDKTPAAILQKQVEAETQESYHTRQTTDAATMYRNKNRRQYKSVF